MGKDHSGWHGEHREVGGYLDHKDGADDHGGWHRGDKDSKEFDDWPNGDRHGKHWTPKPDGDDGMMGDSDKQTGEEYGDDGMSDSMRMKIMAASIVAAVVLIVALIIIIVVCCKAKSKRASAGALKKKNPFQSDPEKATQKPSAKEIEAMQSAPPMMHTLPVVVRPAVVLGPVPTDQKGEKIDYPPPPENPRDQMALWSPPPAYEEKMPKAD